MWPFSEKSLPEWLLRKYPEPQGLFNFEDNTAHYVLTGDIRPPKVGEYCLTLRFIGPGMIGLVVTKCLEPSATAMPILKKKRSP